MATNLQVNAQTGQAVGAFNALANAIANARGQFGNITGALSNGAGAVRQYAGNLTALNTSFETLLSIGRGVFNAMSAIGGGLLLTFSKILGELDKLQGFAAIMSVTTKSTDEAAASYDFLRKTADQLGLQFDALTGNYAKLVAAIPEGTNRLQIAEKAFLGVSMAARTLHSTNADTQLMFYAITQIASKGVVSMEELRRQLGEKLPGAIQIAAKALNTTPELLEQAIRKGIVNSAKFLDAFSSQLIRTFAESSKLAAESVSASLNRLTNVWTDFVKEILDSGAGNAIVNVFDALREKLSDPYLIQRFAELIKYLADRFTTFVKNLTEEDIRNGFDTFTKGVEMMVKVIDLLIKGLTWIINNGKTAGTIMGAVGGAAAGAAAGVIAGPAGMAAGAAIGGFVGSNLGYSAGKALSPTQTDIDQRKASDAAANLSKQNIAKEQELLKFNALIPMLQNFKGLNSLKGLDNLFKAENLNTKTLGNLNKILTGKEYKTDATKASAVLEYASTGQVLGPNNIQLKDVLGAGKDKKPKVDPEVKRLDASFNKAIGLDPNFFDEWNRYNVLFKQGKLTTDQLTDAQAKLLSKQPFVEEAARAEAKEIKTLSKDTTEHIDLILKKIQIKEDVQTNLDEELMLAGLLSDEYRIQSQILSINAKLKDAGTEITTAQIAQLRLTNETRDITAAQNQILGDTVDKYKQQIVQIQAIKKLLDKPSSGLTQQAAQDYTVLSTPGTEGTVQNMEAQKRSMQEYYTFIDLLRKNDLLSEEAANQVKGKAAVDLQQKLTAAYVTAAQTRLELGSTSWVDGAIASLGRLALGFTNLNAGASIAMGNFFQSFTDGFANSIGRAIVYSENLGDALKNVAREGIASLISALVKLGIQWLVQAALGRTIAAAAATAGVATAAAAGTATAMAWAPAAAAVSLATFGTNSVPAMAGISSTFALSQGLSMMGLAGFKKGGYTGDAGVDEITGFTHGKEMVINATATAKNRQALEAINAGAVVSRSNNSTAPASMPSPTINQKIINLLDPSLVKDYLNSTDGEQVIINVIRKNPELIKSTLR